MSEDTKPIRHGEEVNEAKLREFLNANFSETKGEIEIAQFPDGNSNLTYCVKIGDAELVLRRPPFGNQVKSAHDMKREFEVLSKLSKVYPPAPKPLIYCDDESVIGAEFYLMERRKGAILRGKMPEVANSDAGKICESFIENLVELHSLDYKKIGLGDLGKPENYAQRQVEGWTKRYFNAKTDEHTDMEKSIEWLNANIPASGGAAAPTLVHNDYKFDNVMLDPENLTETIAVLDWEMTTVGEPLMDLGTTLGYWMSKDAGGELLSMPFNPRVLMESISRGELVEIYAEKSGRDVSDILFYYVFGTFKIAAIAQQIYLRFAKGFTRDKRFANFNHFVNALGKIALHAIKTEKI